MDFEHPFIATGIGSFPHKDETEAFRLILEHFPHIPFWPQLPKRSYREGMVLQYSEGFPSLKWDDREQRAWVDTSQGFAHEVEIFYERVEREELEPFKITQEFSKGLRILEILASAGTGAERRYVKGQITGPVTFGLGLVDGDLKPIFYDPTLRDILIKHLSLKARWMEERFKEVLPGTDTIVFFDEPSLSSFGSAFTSLDRESVILSLNECFDAVKGLKGVHCCGNTDWSLLLATNLDILSFDAYGFLETVALYPKELKKFLERGGVLAWGIVPTSEDILREDGETLLNRLKKGFETLSRQGIDRAFLRQSLLTPSCGTASLPVPLAERVCQVTSALSRRLREETS